MKRIYLLEIRLNEEEHAAQQAELRRIGLSINTYLRMLILGKPVQECLPINYDRFCTEISRSDNSINRIARIAIQHPETKPDTKRILALRSQLFDELHKGVTMPLCEKKKTT